MKKINLIFNVLIICFALNIISIKSFPQTTTIYQTTFDSLPDTIMSMKSLKKFDYWTTNDSTIQGQYYIGYFCGQTDNCRNTWCILSNSGTPCGSNAQHSLSNNSMAVTGFWGPNGTTSSQSGFNCFYQYNTLCGINYFWVMIPTDRWAYRVIPTTGYDSINLSFQWKCFGEYIGKPVIYGQVGYSLDGGSSWTWLTTGGTKNGLYYGITSTQSASINLPAVCARQAQFAVGFRFVVLPGISSGSPPPSFVIDNVKLTSTPKQNCNKVSITTQPIPVSQCSPASTSFNIATAGDGTISYQWQSSPDGTAWNNTIDGGSKPKYSGSTTATIKIDNAISTCQYRCVATNCSGSGLTTSNSATLKIKTPVSLLAITPGKIKCQGDTTSFKVIATGDSLIYQWSKNGTMINNATNSILSLKSIAISDSGSYSCYINNKCNSFTPITHLTIKDTVVIKSSVSSQTVCQGTPISFTADATGDMLSYQWTKGGKNITGETNSVYSLSSAGSSDYDSYSCTISNTCGSAKLPAFELNVNLAPTSNTIFTKQLKHPNDSVSYNLSPGGTGPFTFQWLNNGNIINGATNSILTINPIACPDSGTYTCQIGNSCDTIIVKVAQLYVNCLRFRHAITGYVKYINTDSTAMTNTNVYLSNAGDTILQNTTTDNTGYYVFDNLINGIYKLKCNTSKAWGGVNPVDALMVNKTYIGLNKLTNPLKRLAADVNSDGRINPVDALLIDRRYINLIHKFSITDWLFSNPTINMNGLDIIKNITAICAGDINTSYTPPTRIWNYELQTTNYEPQSIDINKPFDIPVYLNDNVELGAMGLKFQIPNSNLQIIDVHSDIEGLVYKVDCSPSSVDCSINIAWTAEDVGYNVTPDKPLFYLKAIYNRKPNLSSFQHPTSSIQITSESVLADIDGNYIGTDKLAVPKIIFNIQHSTFSIQNYPNPFSNITNINYIIPKDANVKLIVYNVLGEIVSTLVSNECQKAGQYNVKFDGSNIKQGIYYLRCTLHDVRCNNLIYTKTSLMMIAR